MNELLNWQQKLFLPSCFSIYRMFLFKRDIYMLITKLDLYTWSLLNMCSSPVQIFVFSKAEQFKSSYGKKSILLFGICHQKTVRQLGMSCSINNKNCFFHLFLVFLWCSFLKRITICWWSNCFFHPFFCFFRMFLFQTDNYMLMIKLDLYT